MNQVKKMSLNEAHAYVRENDENQPAMDSRIPSLRSMIIKQSIDASVDTREAAIFPDTTGGTFAADEADSTQDELPERTSRTMT